MISHTDNSTVPLGSSLEVLGGVLSIDSYLERFRVFNPQTLFPPNFENLKENLCPICNRKLYWNREQSKAFCKSKQKDKFFITRNTMSRLGII